MLKTETIDLYNYFGLTRPLGGKGYLDVYILNQSEEYCKGRIRPAVLVIGGGGYAVVSDREREPIALHFMANGYNAFALDYSCAPVRFPAPLIEAAMAMAFIRENAEKYHINPRQIAAIGFSAGGHLTAMLGNIFGEKEVVDALGEKAEDIRPDAVILSYPVVSSGEVAHAGSFDNLCGNDLELKKRLSMENRVTEKSAPAFIWATCNDQIVPSENSLLIAAAYKKAGVPFALHIFENGVHGLSLANKDLCLKTNTTFINPDAAQWLTLMDSWLKVNRGFDVIL